MGGLSFFGDARALGFAAACAALAMFFNRSSPAQAASATPEPAGGGPVAAELSWLLGEPDVLGSRASASHGSSFDSISRATTGRENHLLLAVSGERAGLHPRIWTFAGLRLELDLKGDGAEQTWPVRDSGTSLGLAFRGEGGIELRLELFPFDTDALRLGHLRTLTWGGTNSAGFDSIFVQQHGLAPGVSLAIETSRVALSGAVKWARAGGTGEPASTLWGALIEGQLALLSELRAELGLGYFEQGRLGVGAGEAQGLAQGASLRLVWHRGQHEPVLSPEPFRPWPLGQDGPLGVALAQSSGLAVAGEAVVLVERLQRFEDPRRVALIPAPAAAVYGSLRRDAWGAHVALVWRSLPFVLRNEPGVPVGWTLPVRQLAHAELAAWVGASRTLTPWQLTPSAEFGLLLPAAIETESSLPGYAQTFIVRGPRAIEPLPLGAGRLPVAAARAALRWDASATLGLAIFAEYERDANLSRLQNRGGLSLRGFASPDRLGLGGYAAARF